MMLVKHCTQYVSKFGKLSSDKRTGKVNFHSNPKEAQCRRMFKLLYNCAHFTCQQGNAKERSNNCTVALISNTSKVMLKVLQARLQHYMNRELPDVQTGFRKGRGTRDLIANICWIIEKARVPGKHLFLLY